MSLYPGPVVSQEYAHGRDEGSMHGLQDSDGGGGICHAVIASARHDANAAHTRNERAWWLGYLRGYREAARTLRNGRWGT